MYPLFFHKVKNIAIISDIIIAYHWVSVKGIVCFSGKLWEIKGKEKNPAVLGQQDLKNLFSAVFVQGLANCTLSSDQLAEIFGHLVCNTDFI